MPARLRNWRRSVPAVNEPDELLPPLTDDEPSDDNPLDPDAVDVMEDA
jgi:hypothetical protein